MKIEKTVTRINLAGVVSMTHNDVNDVIWYQIRTPGPRICLQTEFWSDLTNFEKRIYRKSAITVLKFKKQNLGTHLEFNSLSDTIWFHGVSKYDEAVVTKS